MKFTDTTYDAVKEGDRVGIHSMNANARRELGRDPNVIGTVVAVTNDTIILTDVQRGGKGQSSSFGFLPEDCTRQGDLLIVNKIGHGHGRLGRMRPIVRVENPRGEFFATYKEFCDKYGLDSKDRTLRWAITRLTGSLTLSAREMTDTQFRMTTERLRRGIIL